MSASGVSIAVRTTPVASVLSRPFAPSPVAPALVLRQAAPRRTKIWEFNTNLHCSIIGTCLSTHDLRQILKKLGLAAQHHTDHELHGIAVSLAARHDDAARHLHKALDQRHKLAVSQFGRAASEDALRTLWQGGVQGGDIPGAYWATLTHPHATQTLIREAFGEVHMLSHLVGSANRADIRRLRALEVEKAELELKVQRQQQALHDAVIHRDAQIAALRQALEDRMIAEAAAPSSPHEAALSGLIADRERRLAAEANRRAALEERLATVRTERDRERCGRVAAEQAREALRLELAAVEASLPAIGSADNGIRLDGLTLLYVGGRPNQVAHMRVMVEALGGVLLHHDGGVENHQSLLPGLASRCDMAAFPVDCISHDAATTVKALCHRAGKHFIPLRSAGVTSLLAALQTLAEQAMPEQAME
ncbi:MAG: hypothetical protein B7Z80_17090 [Rhodospirillales bacterium 20-64-7]|nr:MAG: hypothetical protein B7Z80_17090 [Rhodospirillales bacterium 20-64-7]HQT78495.1 DUF2325 domain-containing protein [Rhodopila sp.]